MTKSVEYAPVMIFESFTGSIPGLLGVAVFSIFSHIYDIFMFIVASRNTKVSSTSALAGQYLS